MDALQGYGELGMGSRLKRTSDMLMRETQVVYDHFCIDFDPYLFPVFKLISYKEGVTNTAIKNAIGLTQPAITQAINKLVKKGFIYFKNDELDKRKKIIFLSEKGLKQLKQLEPIWEAIDKTLKEFTIHDGSSLLSHLNSLDLKLKAISFSKTIIDRLSEKKLIIEAYKGKKEEKEAFFSLNEEWLRTLFNLEPYDLEVLSNPKKHIINKGGYIFFARLNDKIVGTVALMPLIEQNTFELTKMGVSPKYRGQKIGQKLMQYCVDFSKKKEFPNLVLYSSRKLENAIYIYRKYGFVEIPVEANSPYKRCDIKMKLEL